MSEEEFITKIIYKETGSFLLSQKVTAQLVEVSVVTLKRLRDSSSGPPYKKIGNVKKKNCTIRYPLIPLVEWMVQNNIITAESMRTNSFNKKI